MASRGELDENLERAGTFQLSSAFAVVSHTPSSHHGAGICEDCRSRMEAGWPVAPCPPKTGRCFDCQSQLLVTEGHCFNLHIYIIASTAVHLG